MGEDLIIRGTWVLSGHSVASLFEAALQPVEELGVYYPTWLEVTGPEYGGVGDPGSHRGMRVHMYNPGEFALFGRGGGWPEEVTIEACRLSSDATNPQYTVSKTCPDVAGVGAAWDPEHMAFVRVVPAE